MKNFFIALGLVLLGMVIGSGITMISINADSKGADKKIPEKDFVIGYYHDDCKEDYAVNNAVGLWVDDTEEAIIPSYITISNFSKREYEEFMELDPEQSFYYSVMDSEEELQESKETYKGDNWTWVYYDSENKTMTFSFVGYPPFLIRITKDWGIWLDGFLSERT